MSGKKTHCLWKMMSLKCLISTLLRVWLILNNLFNFTALTKLHAQLSQDKVIYRFSLICLGIHLQQDHAPSFVRKKIVIITYL